jgi:hypothetical protein
MQRAEASRRVRADWLPRAAVAGFSGAVAMLFAFLLAYILAVAAAAARLPEPLREWFFGLTHNRLTGLAGDYLYIAAGAHFFVAIGLALLYARLVEPRIGGQDWLRGVAFALLPWLLSILVVLPLSGGGLFGAELGAGPLPAFGNLVLHLVFGATLGAIYGPFGDLPADSWLAAGPADDPETVRWQSVVMVRGTVIGLATGLVAALAVVMLQPAMRLGGPTASVLLGWMLTGGAFGAFLGSLAGLSRHTPAPGTAALTLPVLLTGPETALPAPPRRRDAHSGAKVGALMGAVVLGPIGMPIGAAAGGVVDALRPAEGAIPAHTHNIHQSPCYDGCPAWRPS